jgi:Flp pilus assembly protein TadD
VIENPKRIDPSGSVWYNLATAYLARKQTKKARSAASEYTRLRKGEARGFMLAGDTYYEDREFPAALDQYLRAEKLLKSNQSREQVELSIRLGKTYRRLPAPANGANPNLTLAVDKLAGAYTSNPNSIELAVELGAAYLEAKQDAKATALTDRLIAAPQLAKAPADQRAAVMVIAGKSLFNEHKLKEARARFEAAQQLKSGDIQIRRALVETINEQAFEQIKEPKAAQAMLEQALAIDPSSPTTMTNLAILAIDRGDCDGGVKMVGRAAALRGNDAVVLARLKARGLACGTKPDPRAVMEAYGAAEAEAKKANAQLALAEVYTEQAPLVWDADPNGAVEKLELAVQIAAQEPEIAPASKRNLAIALYHRGWKLMREGKAGEAANDFERATRDPSLLKGTEPLAFDFSYAVSLLDAGKSTEAAKVFKTLAGKGNQGAYLKGPYAKVGTQFFAAYANYRSASGAARQAACGELAKLEGDLGGKVKELVASCWEAVAYDQWKAGSVGAAQKALQTADKSASADQKRRLVVDEAAASLGKDKLGELEGLGDRPPEALVDLGIVYDMIGKPKEAYEAWQRAKAKGVQTRDLQKWIDAKKRIYGY